MKLSKRDFVVGSAAALGLASLVSAASANDQPHMNKAVEYLQMAKKELQNAAANKGGHRVQAMNLIDQAIREVRAGKQAAR